MKNLKRKDMAFVWVVVCLLFCFCFSIADAAEKDPIKIGFIAPKTGNFAQIGIDMIDGAKLFLEEHNYKVADRKVQIFWEDEGAGPESAVIKVRKLIKHDQVDMVAGIFLTSAAYAVADVCTESKVPLLITLSAGDDITQRKSTNWVNRLSFTGGDIGHVAADYAYKEMSWRKAVTISLDYGWGHESAGGFHHVFEEMGGAVIQKLWCPIATMDYGPYVANIKKEADGIFAVITGAASVRFLKSARESGVLKKMKLVVPITFTDESLLPAHKDNAVGVISTANYSAANPHPLNVKFNELVRTKLKREPASGMMTSWVGLSWLFKAIESLKGDVSDKEKLSKAIRAIEMKDSVRGPLRLDNYGHPIQTYWVRRVDKVGEKYQNTLIKEYPNVNQFWKWTAKEYLSRPVYSREYPPCKHCK